MVLAADGDQWSAGPMSFGMAASWAMVSDEHDLSIRLVQEGIARAASPADPRTTGCWFNLTFSLGFSGQYSVRRINWARLVGGFRAEL